MVHMNIIQGRQHLIQSSKIVCVYNRLTSGFRIFSDDILLFDRLMLWPVRTGSFILNNKNYVIKIRAFPLWRSQIMKKGDVVIAELLESYDHFWCMT